MQHIVDKHHAWLYRQLPVIEQLMDRVADVHGGKRPETVFPLRRIFVRLREELEGHMRKEESVLFPAIVRLEAQTADGGTLPRESFGSLRHPVSMMEDEHDTVAQYLDEMRDLTYGYAPPEDACLSFRTLYHELEALEADIHTHVHLENNILFPRAAQLEREGRSPQ